MVLKASFDGERILNFSSPRKYVSARVHVVPEKSVVVPPFSGKVVKSMLITANNGLDYVFSSREVSPKPIHISPLGYFSEKGSIVFLWKSLAMNKTMRVEAGRKYFFHIGFEESIEHLVLGALDKLDGIEVFNTKWFLSELEYTVIELPSRDPPIKIKNAEHVKVEFRSPVNIIDPYKKTRYRRFLPLAGLLFSYNIGDLARILHRDQLYWQLIDLLNAVLQETHHVWETVKKIYYIYDGKAIPGLTGYIKYYIDHEFLRENEILRLLIENILTHATIMGIGSGRANGFGHITIKTT